MDYKRKIDFAIKLLRSIPQDGPIELSYSGGKDSDCILELAKMAGIPFEAIYKNTTIDPPGTIAHARAAGATIIQPKKTMFQIMADSGWPTRWSRHCCRTLKEYNIYNRCIIGVRRSESTARAKRYKEPEECRNYPGGVKVRHYYPILEWTAEDVAQFVAERGIKCHQLYYDKDGNFHPERRLGCIGCPLASDHGRGDFLEHPRMLRQFIKSAHKFIETHPDSKSATYFPSAYHIAFLKLFCDSKSEYEMKIHSPLFPEMELNVKQYLENYFHTDLTL